jgi:hypothetical protein
MRSLAAWTCRDRAYDAFGFFWTAPPRKIGVFPKRDPAVISKRLVYAQGHTGSYSYGIMLSRWRHPPLERATVASLAHQAHMELCWRHPPLERATVAGLAHQAHMELCWRHPPLERTTVAGLAHQAGGAAELAIGVVPEVPPGVEHLKSRPTFPEGASSP